jgi:hypothetical protein
VLQGELTLLTGVNEDASEAAGRERRGGGERWFSVSVFAVAKQSHPPSQSRALGDERPSMLGTILVRRADDLHGGHEPTRTLLIVEQDLVDVLGRQVGGNDVSARS